MPNDTLKIINAELELYNKKLASRPQIVVANKMDIPGAKENFERLKKVTDKHEIEEQRDKKITITKGSWVFIIFMGIILVLNLLMDMYNILNFYLFSGRGFNGQNKKVDSIFRILPDYSHYRCPSPLFSWREVR